MWEFKVTENVAEEQMGVNWLILILTWKREALLLRSQEGLEKPNWNAGNIVKFKVGLDIFREDILWDQQSYIQSLLYLLESFACGHFFADVLATTLLSDMKMLKNKPKNKPYRQFPLSPNSCYLSQLIPGLQWSGWTLEIDQTASKLGKEDAC